MMNELFFFIKSNQRCFYMGGEAGDIFLMTQTFFKNCNFCTAKITRSTHILFLFQTEKYFKVITILK